MEEKIRVVIYNKTKDYANMQKAEEKTVIAELFSRPT